MVEDHRHTGLSLRAHPVAFLRPALARRRVLSCAEAGSQGHGRRVRLAGVVLVRQRPGSAKGVMFVTIEDETGVANVVLWRALLERQRRVALGARMLGVEGRVQREGEVVHVVAHRLHDLGAALAGIGAKDAVPARGER